MTTTPFLYLSKDYAINLLQIKIIKPVQEADELKNDLTALTLQKFQQLRDGLVRRIFGDNSGYLDVLVQEIESRADEQLDR